MRRPRRSKGFILLMMVVLLLIAGLIAASTSSRSMAGVLEVRRLEDQLQSRWTRISIQRSVLNRAEEIFAVLERNPPAIWDNRTYCESQLSVAGMSFDVRLSDEQAKLNLLVGCRSADYANVAQGANVLGMQLRADVVPRLGQVVKSTGARELLWPTRNWSAFLDAVDIHGRQDAISLQVRTQNVTLWGDGKLAWRRAGPLVLKAQGEMHGMESSLVDLVASLKEDPGIIERGHSLLTDESNCYSLWLIPVSGSSLISFVVRSGRIGSEGTVESFAW